MFELPAPLESLAERVPLEWMSVDRIGTDVRIGRTRPCSRRGNRRN